MTTKRNWGLPLVTNTLEVRKESFRAMVLHQATSLCDRSIPHGDRKKSVGVAPSLGEVIKTMDAIDRLLNPTKTH
jgi:hypothetical protein